MEDVALLLSVARWIYLSGLIVAPAVAGSALLRVRSRTGARPLTLFRRPDAAELARAALVVLHAVVYVIGTYHHDSWLLRPLVAISSSTVGSGACLYLGGIALYALAVRTMGDSFRIGGDPGESTRLVDRGLYARIRHPIYTTMLLEGVGAAIMYPCAFTLGALPLACAGFFAQARREERILVERLGDDYSQYMRRTGRFLPRLRPARRR